MTAETSSRKSVRSRGVKSPPVVGCAVLGTSRPCPPEQGHTCAGCVHLVAAPGVRS